MAKDTDKDDSFWGINNFGQFTQLEKEYIWIN